MNFKDIKVKASEESIEIAVYIYKIKKAVIDKPFGTDIQIPIRYQHYLESYCDKNRIPFYIVTEDCCSVASTYSNLLAHENER